MSVDPKSEVGKLIRRLKRLKNGYHPDFYRKWASIRKELYKTGAYQIFLREVRIRALYRCQRCAKPGRHVHHKVRVYDDPDRVIDVTNGEYLCVSCHRKEHAEEKPTRGAVPTPQTNSRHTQKPVAAHRTSRNTHRKAAVHLYFI